MRIGKPTMHTLLEECEISVRTLNVCVRNGVTTIGEAKDKIDWLAKHAKGFGRRGRKELMEVVNWAREAEQPDLLQSTDYRAYKLEDALMTAEALLQDVQRSLTRVALKGMVGVDTRNHMKLKLLEAAERVAQLPTFSGD